LTDLRTGHLYPPRNIRDTHFCYRLSQPQGQSAAGRIVSMKNTNDTVGNRVRDLLVCTFNIVRVPYASRRSRSALNSTQESSLPPVDKAERPRSAFDINLLKPTGHVTHQQFNIQQLYALPTLYLCVLYLSENKQRLVPLTA